MKDEKGGLLLEDRPPVCIRKTEGLVEVYGEETDPLRGGTLNVGGKV